MKRIANLILILLLLFSLSNPAFAAEISDGNDVVVKKNTVYEGDYRAEVKNGQATAGGVSVSGAPANAVTLVVVPVSGDALAWIDGCVDGKAVAAYDIHFLDAAGNRINASGGTPEGFPSFRWKTTGTLPLPLPCARPPWSLPRPGTAAAPAAVAAAATCGPRRSCKNALLEGPPPGPSFCKKDCLLRLFVVS